METRTTNHLLKKSEQLKKQNVLFYVCQLFDFLHNSTNPSNSTETHQISENSENLFPLKFLFLLLFAAIGFRNRILSHTHKFAANAIVKDEFCLKNS